MRSHEDDLKGSHCQDPFPQSDSILGSQGFHMHKSLGGHTTYPAITPNTEISIEKKMGEVGIGDLAESSGYSLSQGTGQRATLNTD